MKSKIVTVESESSGDTDGNAGDDSGGGGGDDSNEDGGGRVKKVVLPVTYDITALQL